MRSLLAIAFLLLFLTCSFSQTTTITTSLGDITGNAYDDSYLFAGIPYTENPPVGNYRFRPSEMRTSLYSNLDATSFGAKCLQSTLSGTDGDEDCLTLNIWTPNVNGNYSVMLWIHGGSYSIGSGYGDGIYTGTNFVDKDIVFVSVNYRLGLLGFCPLDEIYDETGTTDGGLLGIYDQIIALQWINTYISSFGGNPNEITIFGESAGGLSVCSLTLSPIATGLFNKAIIQSGVCNGPWGPATPIAGKYLVSQTLSNTNLTYLRSLSAMSLLLPPIATIDGYILPNDDILDLTNSITKLNADKIMIGTNSIDSLWAWPFYAPLQKPVNNDQLRQYLNGYFDQTDDTVSSIITSTYYNASSFVDFDIFNKYEILWITMSADACVVCPSFSFIDWILNTDNIFNGDVYLYRFYGTEYPFMTTHFAEVEFVYGLDYLDESAWNIKFNQTLSNDMNQIWADFVKDISNEYLITYDNGIGQNTIIFGNGGITEVVDEYYDEYRGGFCGYLNTFDIMTTAHLCWQDISIDITTTASPTTSDSISAKQNISTIVLFVMFSFMVF